MFHNRSVIEIMIIIFTLVVAFSIMATGALIAVIEIKDPSADTDLLVRSLSSTIILILGSLLGLLAGKSEAMKDLNTRPDGTSGEGVQVHHEAAAPHEEPPWTSPPPQA